MGQFERILCAASMLVMGVAPALAQGGPPTPRGRPASAPAAAPQSQASAFRCPKSGMVFEVAVNGMVEERTSLGADASDPTLCLWKTRTGTSRSYYSRFSPGMAPEGLSALRQGMADLFAGTKSEFSAEYSSGTVAGGRSEYEATWRRVGSETIVVAGRSMATLVFEQTSRGIRGNTSHSVWKFWYAPEVGHWVKNQTVSGGATGRNYQGDWVVHKIIEP